MKNMRNETVKIAKGVAETIATATIALTCISGTALYLGTAAGKMSGVLSEKQINVLSTVAVASATVTTIVVTKRLGFFKKSKKQTADIPRNKVGTFSMPNVEIIL